MPHLALTFWHFVTYTFWHWRTGEGYQWWSGLGSVFTPKDLGVITIAWMLYRKHNCHVPGCWRIQWHVHPGHGHPVCKPHHPHGKPGFVDRYLHKRHHQ